MPLTPQFRFEQDLESCTLFVSLSSAAASTRNTRIFCSDACVTVTCPPYFLQVDLFDDVDNLQSVTNITPGLATIKVTKKSPKLWDQLTAVGTPDEIKARREKAKEAKEAQEAKALDDLKEKKRQDEDYIFHKQWDLEKDEKRTVERQALLHKRSAEEELDKWVAQTEGKETSTSTEPLVTYFDRQLVNDEFNPKQDDTSDGSVPLPAAYHAKTARASVLEHASKKDPVRAFDIREPKPSHKDNEVSSDGQSGEAAKDDKDASDEMQAAAQETSPEEPKQAAEAAPVAPKASQGEEKGKEGEEKPKASLMPGRTGASVNRWEAEKIAWEQHTAAKKMHERGFQDLAERFLVRAREAAPWLHEELVLEPVDLPALPVRDGDVPPRAPAKVEVAFSQGRRNLPARERLETDEEAAAREAEDRRNKELEGRPTNGPLEEQALWLKLRGDHMYRTHDYPGAANAFSACLDLQKNNAEAASNLGVCLLRLGKHAAAISVLTKAVSLFDKVNVQGKDEEKVAEVRSKRGRALVRRAMCYTRIGLIREALADMDKASKVLGDKQCVDDDARGLRDAAATDGYLKYKEEGDMLFKGGQLQEAVNAYDAAIKIDPGAFPAYSNRAACHLALTNLDQCISDCTTGLTLLGLHPPPPRPDGYGGEAMGVKLWVRRGTAHSRKGEWEEARDDLCRAAGADATGNKDLRHDVAMLSGAPSAPTGGGGNGMDARSQALAALDAAGVQRPTGL